METLQSKGQKMYTLQTLDKGIRIDGRSCVEHRPIHIERGVLRTSDGSSRVTIGHTQIFAVVNADMQEVPDSRSVKHRINFRVKLAPGLASLDDDEDEKAQDDDMERDEVIKVYSSAGYHDDRNKRAFREEAVWSAFSGHNDDDRDQNEFEEFELSRTSVYEDALDLIFNKLSNIDYGRFVVSRNHIWTVEVELIVLQNAGNLFEALYLAAKAAVFDFRIVSPIVRHDNEAGKDTLDTTESVDQEECWGIDVGSVVPAGISYRVGQSVCVDLNETESQLPSQYCWVTLKSRPKSRSTDEECEVSWCQIGGGGSCRPSTLRETCAIAVRSARIIDQVLQGYIEKWINEEQDPHRIVHLTFDK